MSLVDSVATPLKLADGRLVMPNGDIVDPTDTGSQSRYIEVPTNREARALVVATRRKLSDLPDVPRTMNAIGAIISYALFGLSDEEIALATGLPESQISRMKTQPSYVQMRESIVTGIIEAESEQVREVFTKHSHDAATEILHTMKNSRHEAVRMAAAKDVLDRAGHRPADVVVHRHKMEGGLMIEIIRKDTSAAPIIDMEVDQ